MATRTSKSKAEVNATLLKSLLKLPGNKFCCDCKVADHPRWASWNLGIFLCIRCSGIHRSMGTHISRVKSVDLDAWTDEQTQSMVKWGNQKANKYWESKLEQSHVPSEGKIDNFVKTKYVSRRWVAAAERPDPDEISDEEGPTVEAVTKSTTQPARPQVNKSSAERAQNPRTRDAASAKEAPNQQIDSLLGMDFINAPQAGPAATAPTAHINPIGRATNVQAAQSNLSLLSSASLPDVERHPTQPSVKPRNDLKTSIMSLYASAPKPQHCPQIQQYPQSRQVPNSFNSTKPALPKPASAFDDLNGLFGGMNVQAASSSQRVQSGPPLQTASPTYNGLRAGSQAASRPVQTTHSIPAAADPWGNDDGDEWTSFQNQTSTPAAPKQSSAFDDLYSTSDVWK